MWQEPSIPVRYTQFPDDYVNDLKGWGFDEDVVRTNAGKLLTLDIDYGDNCSLNCPFCFRRDNSVDNVRHELQFEDLLKIVIEARELGLRSIKLLGAGEPLENSRILEFLRSVNDLGITPVVFSKTGILGDDDRIAHFFSEYGINNVEQLAGELYRCGASIVLGWNSFDSKVQSRMTGTGPEYLVKRNRALEVLVGAGFTDSNPTRLAFGVNPITVWNYSSVFDVYRWARQRNIYAVVTPTMVSGRMKGDNWKIITPSPDQLIKLYTSIYSYNIKTNLTTLNRLSNEGVSSYAGGRPCSQMAVGLYVTLNGIVLSCPGCEDYVVGNVWDTPLEEIWRNSDNYLRQGTFNCRCVAKDGLSIPLNLYSQVAEQLEAIGS